MGTITGLQPGILWQKINVHRCRTPEAHLTGAPRGRNIRNWGDWEQSGRNPPENKTWPQIMATYQYGKLSQKR